MDALLNCPCCGSKADFIDTTPIIRRVIHIGYIRCKKCGLQTRSHTQGRVVKWWNARVEPKAVHE